MIHHAMFLVLLAVFRIAAVGLSEWLDASGTQKA
jgi:hypothetical protein